MKKAITHLAFLSLLFFFFSCGKENHSIRLKNNYGQQINNVRIGSANIGNVASKTTSDYKSVNTGQLSISGTTSSGQTLTGSGSISGKGKHKWTLTVNSSGSCSIAED